MNLASLPFRKLFLFFCFLLLVFSFVSLLSGYEGIALSDATKLLDGEENFMVIFSQIRLPRTLIAILAGASLALAGLVMQATLRNPLASPFTLGISQASAFGASFAIIVLQSYSTQSFFSSSFLVAFFAFLSSLVCTFFILLLSSRKAMLPETLILTGVALGALFSALTMFMQYFASDIDVAATLFWTFGDLAKAHYDTSLLLFVFLLPIALFFYFMFWRLDALLLGDEHAQVLGVNVRNFRTWSMILASLLSALTVAFLGVIGFIGLVAPHIVRLLFQGSHKELLILSLLCGALLLLVADIVSKTLLAPIIIPVGIISSLIGAPLFLYLLGKRGR